MCWVGCLASHFCCAVTLIINITLCAAYFFGLLIECGTECYDVNYTERHPLITAIIGPSVLFLFGCFLSLFAFKRANDSIDGCHQAFVLIWQLLLAACGVLTFWNAYNMIQENLGDQQVIYNYAVYGIAIWNILLMLMSCNIMIQSDAEGLKDQLHQDYQSVEEQLRFERTYEL
eukprot:304910_1